MPSAWCRTAGPTGANLTGLNAINAVTVAFWARPSATESTVIQGDIVRQSSTANGLRDGYQVTFSSTGLTFRCFGSAANVDTSISYAATKVEHGVWAHWAVSFDDSTNLVRFYRNGVLFGAGTNATDMTANAACTTTIFGTQTHTQFLGNLFDIQILPEVVVPPQDIPLLMNPTLQYPGVRGRYFGLSGARVAAGAVCFDESGNGNNLTGGATAVDTADEPPFRPTYT